MPTLNRSATTHGLAAGPIRTPTAWAGSLAWAVAGLLACAVLPTEATAAYTRVGAAGIFRDDPTGGPLEVIQPDASASADASHVGVSAINIGNWVGGPYVVGESSHKFGVAGAAGSFTMLTFELSIAAGTTMGTSFDHNTNVSFSATLTGNASTFNAVAGGSLISVNCIGCGGLIEMGSVSLDPDADGQTTTTSWATNQAMTVSMTTQVENGWAEAGMLSLTVDGNANSGLTYANLTVLSITDQFGNHYTLPDAGGFLQAVPEPTSGAMALAGLLLLAGWRRRARSAA